ncbi:MAG: hypothetical protein AABX77_00405 [Nanoarchaeota archaeon]
MRTLLKFCKKCKGIMTPIGSHFISGKHIFKCFSCGFVEQGEELIEREKIYNKKFKVGEGIVKDSNIFADYPFKCKKCGYNKAEVIERQPYFSDEDTLTFLKCGKCGWSENLAKKTT